MSKDQGDVSMTQNQADRREMTLKQKLSLPEEAPPPWSITIAAVTALVLFINLIGVGPAISSLLLGSSQPSPFLLMLGWTFGLALTLVYVLINRRSSPASWQALRLNRGWLPWQIVLLLGVAIALGVDVTISLASGQFLPIPEIFDFQSQGLAGTIAAALLLVLMQPAAESLVFQAVILPSLRSTVGPWGGVAITSALSALLHYLVFFAPYQAHYDVLWYGLAYPWLTGLAFCLLKVYTGSSRAVIIGRGGAGLIFLLTALALVGG